MSSMATTKRVYKLQEFVAHVSNVNCLKIGRRTSRVLATGGEDHKVNLWAIGKPNAVMSLSGHLSPVESVSFDSSEAMVAAGAASGTIKLWELEEAKIVRTLTGHRSNCISVDFHPFGEFFASGALDTNLKIWDIRRKQCIHTYKGHTRGVNAIRFTPDGRWVVSGGEDNIVKVWDLTAGKLLHDFKFHEGQIQCIDFHPHEFLLATGSADRTVKFWDLETFELIGSAGPEASGVRSVTFSPDGRTLLCGLHESLKVFSWEPVRCHEAVDVSWSRLSDMNVHEGKLLGCSYNQSCVGVWVVDISQVEPYAKSSILRSNGHSEAKSSSANDLSALAESNMKSTGRFSISDNSEPVFQESKSVASTRSAPGTPHRSASTTGSKTASANSTTAAINLKRSSSKPHVTGNPQAINKFDVVPVLVPRTSARSEAVADSRKEAAASADSSKESISSTYSRNSSAESGKDGPRKVVSRNSSKREGVSDSRRETADGRVSAPIVLGSQSEFSDATLRTNSRLEASLTSVKEVSRSPDSRKEVISGRTLPYVALTKSADLQRPSDSSDDLVRENLSGLNLLNSRVSLLSDSKDINQEPNLTKVNGSNATGVNARKSKSNQSEDPSPLDRHEIYDLRMQKPRETNSLNISKGSSNIDVHEAGRSRPFVASWEREESYPVFDGQKRSPQAPFTSALRGRTLSSHRETVSASDEDAISDLMEQHEQFLNATQHRVKKLQVVRGLWEGNDVKGAIIATDKMCDHAVSADLVGALMGKSDIVTLEICAFLLPLLSKLTESLIDRHLSITLEMLLKLVNTFGTVIHSTLSASSSVGVDIQAEQRLERCNQCFIELEKVKSSMPSLLRRGGSVGKTAQELSLALHELV